jgi:hypothetical protein
MLGEVVSHLIALAIEHTASGLRRTRYLRHRVVHPAADMRVVFSALLRIVEGDKYLLIRNLHRPESFSPIGGVYKYFNDAKTFLDRIEFRPHHVDDDMERDLRGFVPRRHIGRFVKWFHQHEGRESPTECVCRELREEMKEIRMKGRCPTRVEIRHVRSVYEGPERVPGQSYLQFRQFDIFEIADGDARTKQFLKRLIKSAQKNPDLLFASNSEIISGRAENNALIGHPAGYLIGKRRVRPDAPLFASPQLRSPTAGS